MKRTATTARAISACSPGLTRRRDGILKMLKRSNNSAVKSKSLPRDRLTNLALAIRLAPETMRRVKRISIMGSAGLGTGNVTPHRSSTSAGSGSGEDRYGGPDCRSCLSAGTHARRIHAQPARNRIFPPSGPLGRFAIDCNRCLMEMNAGRFGSTVWICGSRRDGGRAAPRLQRRLRRILLRGGYSTGVSTARFGRYLRFSARNRTPISAPSSKATCTRNKSSACSARNNPRLSPPKGKDFLRFRGKQPAKRQVNPLFLQHGPVPVS